MKPEVKRPKTSTKEEEWVEVPTKKNLRKKKPKSKVKRPEWPKRARPEAMLIMPAEGVSYAAILKDLKRRVRGYWLLVLVGLFITASPG